MLRVEADEPPPPPLPLPWPGRESTRDREREGGGKKVSGFMLQLQTRGRVVRSGECHQLCLARRLLLWRLSMWVQGSCACDVVTKKGLIDGHDDRAVRPKGVSLPTQAARMACIHAI